MTCEGIGLISSTSRIPISTAESTPSAPTADVAALDNEARTATGTPRETSQAP
jgi:hypothetical protein